MDREETRKQIQDLFPKIIKLLDRGEFDRTDLIFIHKFSSAILRTTEKMLNGILREKKEDDDASSS